MKKRIAVIVFFLSVLSQVFAGGYKYWEDSKFKDGITIHLKLCYPSSFNDSQTANEQLRRSMSGLFSGLEQNSNVQYILSSPYADIEEFATEIHPKDGSVYRVVFMHISSLRAYGGIIAVVKGTPPVEKGKPMEQIYYTEDQGFDYDYDYYCNLYEAQCNKYLNML